MRLIRFYRRLRNQYRIHHYSLPLWWIVKISWYQSKKRKPRVVNPIHIDLKDLDV